MKNKKGETIGTIEKLLKDSKTGKVEYAVLELADTKFQHRSSGVSSNSRGIS